MFELFMVGTFPFWALIVAEIIALLAFVEAENGIGATVSLLVGAAALQWMGNVDMVGYVVHNPAHTLAIVAVYFLCGTAWGIFKWRLFVQSKLDRYLEVREQFFRDRNVPAGTKEVPEGLRERWVDLLDRMSTSEDVRKPLARNHKAAILRWMTFWVFSMAWFFLNDLVKGIFQAIYGKIARRLQRIADNVWSAANVQEDTRIVDREN